MEYKYYIGYCGKNKTRKTVYRLERSDSIEWKCKKFRIRQSGKHSWNECPTQPKDIKLLTDEEAMKFLVPHML